MYLAFCEDREEYRFVLSPLFVYEGYRLFHTATQLDDAIALFALDRKVCMVFVVSGQLQYFSTERKDLYSLCIKEK